MLLGILNHGRVRLLLSKGHSCYKPGRTGERKRKSVRGCIVNHNLSILNLAIVKKGEGEIEGLTDKQIPRRLGPKRANNIRKLFALDKSDPVTQYVIRKAVEKNGKTKSVAPKIQRLITPVTLQRKRRRMADKVRFCTLGWLTMMTLWHVKYILLGDGMWALVVELTWVCPVRLCDVGDHQSLLVMSWPWTPNIKRANRLSQAHSMRIVGFLFWRRSHEGKPCWAHFLQVFYPRSQFMIVDHQVVDFFVLRDHVLNKPRRPKLSTESSLLNVLRMPRKRRRKEDDHPSPNLLILLAQTDLITHASYRRT